MDPRLAPHPYSVRLALRRAMPHATPEEYEAMLALIEVRAESVGMTSEEWARDFRVGIDGGYLPPRVAGRTVFFEDGRSLITLSPRSDVSTVVHELGHVVRRQLPGKDQAVLKRHYGVKDWSERIAWKTVDRRWPGLSADLAHARQGYPEGLPVEEVFAHDVESYCRGESPRETPPRVKGIFGKIKAAISKVYQRVVRHRVSDVVADVLDRAFGGPEGVLPSRAELEEKEREAFHEGSVLAAGTEATPISGIFPEKRVYALASEDPLTHLQPGEPPVELAVRTPYYTTNIHDIESASPGNAQAEAWKQAGHDGVIYEGSEEAGLPYPLVAVLTDTAVRPLARQHQPLFHGSGRTFQTFQDEHVGDEQGVVGAYGHGHYFTDEEEVARRYRDSAVRDLVKRPTYEGIDGQAAYYEVRSAGRAPTAKEMVAFVHAHLAWAGKEGDRLGEGLKGMDGATLMAHREQHEAIIALLYPGKQVRAAHMEAFEAELSEAVQRVPSPFGIRTPGAVYVTTTPPWTRLLSWEDPMAGQDLRVKGVMQTALAAMGFRPEGGEYVRGDERVPAGSITGEWLTSRLTRACRAMEAPFEEGDEWESDSASVSRYLAQEGLAGNVHATTGKQVRPLRMIEVTDEGYAGILEDGTVLTGSSHEAVVEAREAGRHGLRSYCLYDGQDIAVVDTLYQEPPTPRTAPLRNHALDLPPAACVHWGQALKELKGTPKYALAKAGQAEAAYDLVSGCLTPALVERLRAQWGAGCIFVAPHAAEQTGHNAIPQTMASVAATIANGSVDTDIVQANRAHHTGARMMQRLVTPVVFEGPVVVGGRYVLVDDNVTSGGTMADLGSFIKARGGEVVGVMTLTTSDRSATFTADPRKVAEVERRFGDEIRQSLAIDPRALTEAELEYLRNYRDVEQLRESIAKAREEVNQRIRPRAHEAGSLTDTTPVKQRSTDSAAFKKWFGDSKVVTPDGAPLVVYHGTNAVDFDRFSLTPPRTAEGMQLGLHFGQRHQANARLGYGTEAEPDIESKRRDLYSVYADWAEDEVVMTFEEWVAQGNAIDEMDGHERIMPVYLSLQNPYDISSDLGNWADPEMLREYFGPGNEGPLTQEETDSIANSFDLVRLLTDKGYDGIVYDNAFEGAGKSWIAFRPEQVKSVYNKGTWSRADPRILYQTRADEEHPLIAQPAFKQWFGDSQIVDESGAPLVLYHGTDREFSTFRLDVGHSPNSQNDGYYGNGIYAALRESRAADFGTTIKNLYMKIENPFHMDGFDAQGTAEALLAMEGFSPAQRVFLETVRSGGFESGLAINMFDELFAPGQSERDVLVNYGVKLTQILKRNGYDGVIVERADADENTEVVAFSPEQVYLIPTEEERVPPTTGRHEDRERAAVPEQKLPVAPRTIGPLYHGTGATEPFSHFDSARGDYGAAYFADSMETAKYFGGEDGAASIVEVTVSGTFFDVDDTACLTWLKNHLKKNPGVLAKLSYDEYETWEEEELENIENGNYDAFEDTGLDGVLTEAGFDGYTTYEQEGKNYAVFRTDAITIKRWLGPDGEPHVATNTTMEEYFHVTPARNIQKILSQGLVPKIGARSKTLGEKTPAVYLFTSIEDAKEALGNWLGEQFGDSTKLAVLKVRCPSGMVSVADGQFEAVCTSIIPADMVRVVTKDADRADWESLQSSPGEMVLYHVTKRENEESIRREGLRLNLLGEIHLSTKPITGKRVGNYVLEVRIPDQDKLIDWREAYGPEGDGDTHQYDPENPYFIYLSDIPPAYIGFLGEEVSLVAPIADENDLLKEIQDQSHEAQNTTSMPEKLYHGSDGPILAFDEAMTGEGIWLTEDKNDALDYGPVVHQVRATLRNPAHFERHNGDEGIRQAIEDAKAHGHDGMVVTGPEDGDESGMYWPKNYVVFSGKQIQVLNEARERDLKALGGEDHEHKGDVSVYPAEDVEENSRSQKRTGALKEYTQIKSDDITTKLDQRLEPAGARRYSYMLTPEAQEAIVAARHKAVRHLEDAITHTKESIERYRAELDAGARPAHPGWESFLREGITHREARKQHVEALCDHFAAGKTLLQKVSTGAVATVTGEQVQYAVLIPASRSPGDFQLSFFDRQGPYTHVGPSTMERLLARVLLDDAQSFHPWEGDFDFSREGGYKPGYERDTLFQHDHEVPRDPQGNLLDRRGAPLLMYWDGTRASTDPQDMEGGRAVTVQLASPLVVEADDPEEWLAYMDRYPDRAAVVAAGYDGVVARYTDGELEVLSIDESSLTPCQERMGQTTAVDAEGHPTLAMSTRAKAFYQPAYHGSPYRFDAFSADAIGTGEGHASFGYGLYFTESKQVAQWYREKLALARKGYLIDGELILDESLTDQEREVLTDVVGWGQGSTAMVEDTYLKLMALPHKTEDERRRYVGLLGVLSTYAGMRIERDPGEGQLYEVELPDEGNYLDWDKPLSAQPAVVQEAFAALAQRPVFRKTAEGYTTSLYGRKIEIFPLRTEEGYGIYATPGGFMGRYASVGAAKARVTREGTLSPSLTGKVLYETLTHLLPEGTAKAASAWLSARGIPGIRYVDGQHRHAPTSWTVYTGDREGEVYTASLLTYGAAQEELKDARRHYANPIIKEDHKPSNYVVFSDDDVAVTKTFYQPARSTEGEAFFTWFGESKVVDTYGKPLVVYRGDRPNLESIAGQPGAILKNAIFFTDSRESAKFYTKYRTNPLLPAEGMGAEDGLYSVYLSLKNPLVIEDAHGSNWAALELPENLLESNTDLEEKVHYLDRTIQIDDLAQWAMGKGYDGLIVRNMHDQSGVGDQYVAFSPTQIKSVDNVGTWSSHDNRILYQPAYHGSPYSFDRFTTDAIGRGEGALAYGWGLYFAGKRAVAEWYRDRLTGGVESSNCRVTITLASGKIYEYDGNDIVARDGEEESDEPGVTTAIAEYFMEYGYLDGFQHYEAYAERHPEWPYIQNARKDLAGAIAEVANGQVYRVELPEDEDYLDWDCPLAEQDPRVQAAALELLVSSHERDYYVLPARVQDKIQRYQAQGEAGDLLASMTGEMLYAALKGSRKERSLSLHRRGIPGIRYLDGSSRAAGEGDHNYVIFDENDVTIIETYYQTAFHGSPYQFDRFSHEKIGSGEGAQSYGYGHYFAEQEAVAEWYRTTLSNRSYRPISIQGKSIKDHAQGDMLLYVALNRYARHCKDDMGNLDITRCDHARQEALRLLASERNRGPRDEELASIERAEEFIMSLTGVDLAQEQGQVYEVNIPGRDTFLDWDATMEEQSVLVRERLEQALASMGNEEGPVRDVLADALYDNHEGAVLYWNLEDAVGDRRASELLLSWGINGTMYLDQHSRAAGEGSRNYVVFSDDAVEITRTLYQSEDQAADPDTMVFDATKATYGHGVYLTSAESTRGRTESVYRIGSKVSTGRDKGDLCEEELGIGPAIGLMVIDALESGATKEEIAAQWAGKPHMGDDVVRALAGIERLPSLAAGKEVEIPENEDLLAWDTCAQSARVQAGLQALGDRIPELGSALAEGMKGEELYRLLALSTGTEEAASRTLREVGILGHRVGEGKFVIYDERDVQGLEGPVRQDDRKHGITVRTECVGAHHGQTDLRLSAYENGREVGYAHVVEYEGRVSLSMIEVLPSHRRRGIGTALVREAQSLTPDEEIVWGWKTADGRALRASLPHVVACDHEGEELRVSLLVSDAGEHALARRFADGEEAKAYVEASGYTEGWSMQQVRACIREAVTVREDQLPARRGQEERAVRCGRD